VRQRIVLTAVLLLVACVLVVGTQNIDERVTVHLLLWSLDSSLLVVFLSSLGLGIALAELFRVLRSVRRRRSARASAS
jgi:uncharacterized integral membrane protein